MRIGLLLSLLLVWLARAGAENEFHELSPARVAEIEAMLPETPGGFGRPITDRAFWESAKVRQLTAEEVSKAEPLLTKPFPAWSDELYLEFERTGRRPPGEAMIRARSAWLDRLTLAECVENRGRFLPVLETTLAAYLLEPSWTLPAHDWHMENFRGHKFTVDLRSSAFAADLAQTLHLLGDRLSPALRARVLEALDKRIFAPVRQSLKDGQGQWWLGSKDRPVQNNWNAVCLAGVASAARTVLADRRDRAVFLAAGEHCSRYFINGFTEDGYCDEGPGYWMYGFGDFVALREILVHATGGRVDLFTNPKTRLMALYGSKIQFPASDVPPYADCRFGTTMSGGLTGYCDRVLGLGKTPATLPDGKPFLRNMAWLFLTETPSKERSAQPVEDLSLRSYFDTVGVLVCRPGEGGSTRLAASIKAGGNGSHSHNDIGSFVLSLDGWQPVGDPGGPHAYDNESFGPRRYERRLLNSFGHPVPVVDGQLQIDATTVKPKVLETVFGESSDRIVIDLTPAYRVPALRRLTRAMTYSREGHGSVEIVDHVLFEKESSFETALTTHSPVRQTAPGRLEFSENGKTLAAEVTTPDGFELTLTTIEEMDAPAFTRAGLKLKKPVREATVRVRFETGD